jgi:hypothetical protein
MTTFPVFADGFHRRHGPSAPSRGPLSSEEGLPKKREASPHSTTSRASLGHRFCSREHGERSRATNQPETRPTFRDPRRPRTMRPHRDAFGRPSLVRAREDYSSACSSGTRKTARRCRWVVAVPGSRRLCDCSLRSLLQPSTGCPALCWRLAALAGGRSTDADLSMGGVVEQLGGGVLEGVTPLRYPSRAAASGTTSTTEHFRG